MEKQVFRVDGVKVIFTQPFEVGAELAALTTGSVAVLDIAFNGGRPGAAEEEKERAFVETTATFIGALGNRLTQWVDHHPSVNWSKYSSDSRFCLYTRDAAPACPTVITPETVKRVDTIVTHGDFDGIMSAAKYLLGGIEPYAGADADAVAADTRTGKLSERGKRSEQALKADLRDDEIRAAILRELTCHNPQVRTADAIKTRKQVDAAVARYQAVDAETRRVAGLYEIRGGVAVADSREAGILDMTALLVEGQKIAPNGVAIAISRNPRTEQDVLAVAGDMRKWNLPVLFGTHGATGRIQLPVERLEEATETVNKIGPDGNVGKS